MVFSPCRTNKIMEYIFNPPSFNDALAHGVGCRHSAPNHFLSQCLILILRNSKEIYYGKYVFISSFFASLWVLSAIDSSNYLLHWHQVVSWTNTEFCNSEKWRFINISWTNKPQHHHVTFRCGSQLFDPPLWVLRGIHNWWGFFLSRWAFFLAGEVNQQSWQYTHMHMMSTVAVWF